VSNPQDGTGRAALDRANANTVLDALRSLSLGSLLSSQLVQQRRMQVPATNAHVVSTYNTIALPANAKANSIVSAYVRKVSGGAVLGALTPATYAAGSNPATGEISIAPNGDIAVLASDAATLIDVSYTAIRGDVIELFLPVVTGVCTIPASYVSQGVIRLVEAEILKGTAASVGKVVILAESDALPATKTACLKVARDVVNFNNATDAVTRARVKLVLAPKEDLCTILEAQSNIL